MYLVYSQMFLLNKLVLSRYLADSTLSKKKCRTIESMYYQLKLCLTSRCFPWREKFYEQTHGAPMGSPLSAVMDNLFMEEFEKKALATATLKPGFWFRYVDNVWVADLMDLISDLQVFLGHINSLHPSIKFTFEVQNDNKTISSLTALFELGSLGHKIYGKPSHRQASVL